MKHNIIHRILAKAGIIQILANRARRDTGQGSCPKSLADFNIGTSINDPNKFYTSCVAYFDQQLPTHVKDHRTYFSQDQRGFGEDAFHVLWSLLVAKFKPVYFLEIGVYRGQVLSLVSLLQRDHGIEGNNTGIGPFERIGDLASVKDYGHCPDWLADIRTNIDHFGLPQPRLLKALSTDADAVSTIQATTWDMIYIDGNHDYEVVLEDWRNCCPHVKVGGVIVLDDSGLDSGYRPPLFATGGFPGPSKIANSAGQGQFEEILQVGHNRAFQRIQ
jgi:hypothetical protein